MPGRDLRWHTVLLLRSLISPCFHAAAQHRLQATAARGQWYASPFPESVDKTVRHGWRPHDHRIDRLWIPAPRFRRDKLRGNDEGGAGEDSCRGSGGVPQVLFSTPKIGGHRGLTRRTARQVVNLRPTDGDPRKMAAY
jgi:hypothetical protein